MNRRRAARVVFIATVALVVLGVVLVAAMPEIVRRVVVWRLAATTGRAVTLAGVDIDLFAGRLGVRGLTLADRDQRPLATMSRLEATFSPRHLLRGHLRIVDASIEAPTLRIVRTGPREFNVSDLFAPREGGGAGLAFPLARFTLRGGAIDLEDRTLAPPRAWRVENIAVDAREVSTVPGTQPGVVTLHAVAAGSPISVWVAGLRPSPLRMHATVMARDIDASVAGLYFPPASPLAPARGFLNVSGTVEHDTASGTRVAFDLGFAQIELARPGQEQTYLAAPAVRVKVEDLRVREGIVDLARLEVDGGTVTLLESRLVPARRWQADGVFVEARNLSSARGATPGVATARAVVAGSPVSVWASNIRLAPLTLHATAITRNVDVTPFRVYLPAGWPVHPEAGVVDATVTVDQDDRRGTRIALDAVLRDLDVRRPPHVLTAPSVRVTAEDIVLATGTVTVARAAITAARMTVDDRTLTPMRTWPVQDFAVEASRLSSRRDDIQGVATARATVARAALSAWLTRLRIHPLELHATAILRNADVALLRPYLPPDLAVDPRAGVVDASIEVKHTLGDGTSLTGDAFIAGALGRIRAGGAEVTAPSVRLTLADGRRHGETVTVGRFELSGAATVTDPRTPSTPFHFDRLSMTAEGLAWPVRGPARVAASARLRDGGEIDASGTAELTAPPPDVAWRADVDVKLRSVDLGPLAAYVPVASGLRGRATAAVTASVARAHTLTARVRGDASLSRLALADAARTPVSVRQVELSALDVEWPERVAIGKVRIVEPHALVERDRQGNVPLLGRVTRRPQAPAVREGSAATPPAPAISLGEVSVERGALVFTDESVPEPARFELPRIDATVRDVTWPARGPARLRVDAALPRSGTAAIEGTVTIEPARVDLDVVVANAPLALARPYLPLATRVRGRVDAKLAVAGPLGPALSLTAGGSATLRRLAILDATQPVITVESIDVTGIRATWPEKVSIDGVRVRRSWARLERDAQGDFLLRRLFARRPGMAGATSAPGAPAAGPASSMEVELREAVLEDGTATIVDAVTTPPARFDIAGARLTVRDFAWPARGPMKLALTSPTPGGGEVSVSGTLLPEPVRLDARVVLGDVELAPAQPYLPIEARISGRATGDLTVVVALDPLAVQVRGDARVQRFRLGDRDRALVSVRRADASGIEVDWPRRIRAHAVRFGRPRLLVERDAQGDILLVKLIRPRWAAATPAIRTPAAPDARAATVGSTGPRASTPTPTGAATGPAAPTIDIGTFAVDRASARFVDQTTTPPYAEELSDVDLTFTDVTTAPNGRTKFTATGAMPGGASFKLGGEFATGDRRRVDVTVDLRDVVVPRANPYLAKYTSWTATRGTASAAATYRLDGTQVSARQDLVIRGLAVTRSAEHDEVERRLGLPLGFLVSVLQDARGEIRLALPVAGDLSNREFDFSEAVWATVRNLAIRLIALPFSRVGSLFFSEDSKLEAVAITPVVFEPGTSRLGAGMDGHLDRIAALLRERPAVSLGLAPIVTAADVDALKREAVLGRVTRAAASGAAADAADSARRAYAARWPDREVPATVDAIVSALAAEETLPPAAPRNVSARRLDVVLDALRGRGVDPGRLQGRARRGALVEADGAGRVELDLRPPECCAGRRNDDVRG